MKVIFALIVVSLAVLSHASYLPSTSVWPYSNGDWNSWNSWNNWNGLNTWTGSHLGLTGGYPSSYYNNLWTSPSLYDGGLYGGHKTVVQTNVVNGGYPWEQPWGTYGAGVYGWGGYSHHGYAKTVVPVEKQVAATPGSVHVAPVPVDGVKVVAGY
ncbi:uncharacterized protein LOC129741204 [Uranotaenia lowii]|uniref:uncharacterized protein LOC129741204 n=1 Tax=Uranotaenia lowii TaxID=190385 RepID=UPI00247A6559|nr:uncharacterized protein LOC129741204 [Uranotaenia lowii]